MSTLVKPSELKPAELLSDEEIAFILPILDEVVAYAKQVKAHALSQVLAGKVIPGYKLVEGKSDRKIIDQDAVVKLLVKSGINEAALYDKTVKSLTKLESLVGKKKFDELVGFLVEKPKGAPTLVAVTDKRPEFKQLSASEEFADIKEEDL